MISACSRSDWVLALDVPELAQRLTERLEYAGSRRQVADPVHLTRKLRLANMRSDKKADNESGPEGRHRQITDPPHRCGSPTCGEPCHEQELNSHHAGGRQPPTTDSEDTIHRGSPKSDVDRSIHHR
jgi:hypothetical protein